MWYVKFDKIDDEPNSIEQVTSSNRTGNLAYQDNNNNSYNNSKIYNILI